MGNKSKKNMKDVKTINTKSKLYEAIIFALLSMLLFMLPFHRGLFFQGEIMIAHMSSLFLLAIFLLNKIVNKTKLKINCPTDYIGLLLIAAYFLPIISFQWANLRDSIGMVLWSINTFAIYFMTKEYAREVIYKKLILNTLLASGVTVITIGLLASFGYIEYADAVLGNRISSTFQYPNTLAAYSMMLFFIAFGMMTAEKKYWLKTVYAIVGFLMFFVFVFTYSRAAWLIFPFMAIIYFIAIPYKDKAKAIFYAFSVIAPTIFLIQPFTKYLAVAEEIKMQALTTLLIGMAAFTLIHMISDRIINLINRNHIKYIFISSALAAAITIGFVFVAVNTTEAIEFDNMNIVENRSNYLTRTIKDILTSEDYVLKINVEGTSQDEKQWPWRIRITSSNEDSKSKLIVQRLGNLNESGEILIPFTTFEDTDSLIIQLLTLFPETKATFNDVELMDDQGILIREIPLKYTYIPEAIMSRINSIEIENNSAQTRINYIITGLSMVKSNPIIGAGGGAWKAQFSRYQNEPFFSTQTHNYYIQTIVETGIFGISLIAFLIALLLYMLVTAALEKNIVQISIITGLLALLAHSALDFNFSFLSIALIFWTLLGVVQPRDDKIKFKMPIFKLSPKVALLITIPLLIFTASLYYGHTYGVKAVQAAEAGDFSRAAECFQTAVERDPFENTFRMDLGHLLRQTSNNINREEILSAAEDQYLKALKAAPENSLMLQQVASYFISVGQFDKAIESIDKSLEFAPLNPTMYEQKLTAYTAIGSYFIDNGNLTTGLDVYKKSLSIIDRMTSVNAGIREKIAFTDETVKNINRVKYFIDNADNLQKLNRLADLTYMQYLTLDVDSDEIPDTWRHWKPANSNLETEVTETGVIISNDSEIAAGINSNKFELKPSTTYALEIELTELKQIDYIRFYVLSKTGKHVQFHQSGIPKTADGKHRFLFKTTEDIEAGDQYIRIDHLGNTAETFTVESIQVFLSEEDLD